MHTNATKLPNSTDIHLTFHSPLSLGKARMKTKMIKLEKRIVSVEGKIYSQRNKLAAFMLHTAMLFDPNLQTLFLYLNAYLRTTQEMLKFDYDR